MQVLPYTLPLNRAHLFEELLDLRFSSLSSLLNSGVNAPASFVVTNEARKHFYAHNHIDKKLEPYIKGLNLTNPIDLQNFSANVTPLILAGEVSRDLLGSLEMHLSKMPSNDGDILLYRDSRYRNFVTKTNMAELSSLIKKIWAADFRPEAILKHKFKSDNLSVLISHIPQVLYEGTITAMNPDNFSHDEAVLKVKDYKYIISKSNPVLPKGMQQQHLDKVLRMAKSVDDFYFFPQETSFFASGDEIYFMDAKQLTHFATPTSPLVKPFPDDEVKTIDYYLGQALLHKRHVGKVVEVLKPSDLVKVRRGTIVVCNNEKIIKHVVSIKTKRPAGILYLGKLSPSMQTKLHKLNVLTLETDEKIPVQKIKHVGVLDGREGKFYFR